MAIRIMLAKGDQFKINFDGDNGRIVGTVTITLDGTDTRPPHERRQAAAAKFRLLAAELAAAMEQYET